MIDTEKYLRELTNELISAFGERLCCIGLQGSYLRNEADESSDFDVMLVIDALSPEDLDVYRGILISLGHYDISCGFVCGKDDLACWNPLEACHLIHTTRDIYGKLESLMPAFTDEDVRNFIRLSIGNMFHELCHRYVYRTGERNAEALPFTYKGVFFILQNLHYLRSGVFVGTKAELLGQLNGEDRELLEAAMVLKDAKDYDYNKYYGMLFRWCQSKLKEVYHE